MQIIDLFYSLPLTFVPVNVKIPVLGLLFYSPKIFSILNVSYRLVTKLFYCFGTCYLSKKLNHVNVIETYGITLQWEFSVL